MGFHASKWAVLTLVVAACATGRDDADIDAGQIPLIVDAGPTHNLDAGCVLTWQNLLVNGDFDDGELAWQREGSGILRQEGDGLPLSAHSQPWVAWLLGYANADERLSQTVTVPSAVQGLRLRFQSCFVTEETGISEDFLTIELTDPKDNEVLVRLSNQDAVAICEWSERTYEAGILFPGRDVTLSFHGTSNDDNESTSFFVDSVVLEAATCQ